MRSFALVLVLVLAGLTPARACPPPGPCAKYRRIEPLVQRYQRERPAPLPTRVDRSTIERLLVGSSWTPSPPNERGSALPIVFVRPAEARNATIVPRTILIREIERRGEVSYVAIDGVYYALRECRQDRVRSACLELVGALPSQPAPHRFATPPP